jgi:lipoate-protein ligase A
LNGLKISGTASHVFKNRVLHHGTLLFESEMDHLEKALRVNQETFEDKAVKSVRSDVTNISDHLKDKMEINEFQMLIFHHVRESFEDAEIHRFTKKDLDEIHHLRHAKFSTWEWNFGYSPKYQFHKVLEVGSGRIELKMNVEKGVIREVHIEGDFMSSRDVRGLEKTLEGNIHDPQTLRMKLEEVNVSEYIIGLENEALISGMF